MKSSDFLIARHNGVVFCIEIGDIRQIMAYQKNFKVPKSPAVFSGVIHMKGGIVPIIELSGIFAMPPVEPTPFSVTVVVEIAKRRYGFVFDAVEDIVPSESLPVTESQRAIAHSDFITSVVAFEDEEAFVLDIANMMTLVDGACPVTPQKEAV